MRYVFFILVCFFIVGCTDVSEIECGGEVEYIDYSNIPEEKLTSEDRLLLSHVNFEDGVLSCSLDLNEALKQGILKEKYHHFLSYLEVENERIKGYLDSGAVVFYGEKPFARDEKLYQYVGNPDDLQSRGSDEPIVYKRVELTVPYGSGIRQDVAPFVGPSSLGVHKKGRATVHISESSKGLSFYFVAEMGDASAKFVYGSIVDEVFWSWSVSCMGSGGDKGIVEFYGVKTTLDDLPMPFGMDPKDTDNPSHPIYTSRLPSNIVVQHIPGSPNLMVGFMTRNLTYSIKIYEKINNSYRFYFQKDDCEGGNAYNVPFPIGVPFLLVIYRVQKNGGTISYDYVGDKLFAAMSIETPWNFHY